MSSIHSPFLRYFLLLSLTWLGGCSRTVFIKAPVNLYHDIEGGIVSQPRLPVPGNNETYPYVGLTPTAAPPLPSPELRRSITDSLSHDRNLADWETVQNPLTVPAVPPLPNQPSAPSSQSTADNTSKNKGTQPVSPSNDAESSASFDAAGQTPSSSTTDHANNAHPLASPATQSQPSKPVPKPSEAVVMPALRTVVDDKNVIIPEIPVNPPSPPKFPGFNVPADVNLPSPEHPSSLPLDNPVGELIRFPVDSDTPFANQDGTINTIAWHRNGGILYVHGYGDTTSMDSEAQTKALTLALLRAKTVAKMLIAHNVPESAIVIRAHAFGHGVRIRMDD